MPRRKPTSLFDPTQARGPDSAPRVVSKKAGASKTKGDAISVSDLIGKVKDALTGALPKTLAVVGELSNVKQHGSGHIYFRVKDASATMDAVMFRGAASKLKFVPTDGVEVVLRGKVDVYDARGQLQFYATRMSPVGEGGLELAFRQLRDRLETEGLFEADRKKPLPRFPRGVGIITSASGAALRDMERTLRQRWSGANVYLLPATVQGESAAAEIAGKLIQLDQQAAELGIDVILLARGGGSMEDLWAFNEEVLARAIADARTPIVSGVGHETDVTIADMVSDHRAATPTAAAMVAVPDRAELAELVGSYRQRITLGMSVSVKQRRERVAQLSTSTVFLDPDRLLRHATQRADELHHRLAGSLLTRLARARNQLAQPADRLARQHPATQLERARGRISSILQRLRWALGSRAKRAGDTMLSLQGRLATADPQHRVAMARQHVEAIGRQLDAMSYRNVLARGYTVTRSPEGQLLTSAAQAKKQPTLVTEFSDGTVETHATAPPLRKPKRTRKSTTTTNPTTTPTLFDQDLS